MTAAARGGSEVLLHTHPLLRRGLRIELPPGRPFIDRINGRSFQAWADEHGEVAVYEPAAYGLTVH